MSRIIIVLIFSYIFFAILNTNVEARLLPRFQNVKVSGKRVASGVGISVRLRPDHKAILVYFSNLNKASSVSYTLTYQTDGRAEGVSSVLTTGAEDSATRELLFGTCSSGVCRYHTSISGMKFEVVSELLSGKRSIKRFKIRL